MPRLTRYIDEVAALIRTGTQAPLAAATVCHNNQLSSDDQHTILSELGKRAATKKAAEKNRHEPIAKPELEPRRPYWWEEM